MPRSTSGIVYGAPDAAVLDFTLLDGSCEDAVRLLRSHDVPIVAATGKQDIPEDLADMVTIAARWRCRLPLAIGSAEVRPSGALVPRVPRIRCFWFALPQHPRELNHKVAADLFIEPEGKVAGRLTHVPERPDRQG